jgi:endoglucanase
VLTDLAGCPIPTNAKRMPKFPRSLSGTWLRGAYDNYRREGTDEHVRSLIDIAWEFARKRGVPVFCGEFGAFQPNSAEEDRARWCRTTRAHLEARGIAWALWDYAGGFGIYNGPRGGSVDSDLSVPVAEALGLSIRPSARAFAAPSSRRSRCTRTIQRPGFSRAVTGSPAPSITTMSARPPRAGSRSDGETVNDIAPLRSTSR